MTAIAHVETTARTPTANDRVVPQPAERKAARTTLLRIAVALGVVACATPGPARLDREVAPIFGVALPPAYRDWRLISVAHEAGDFDDLRAILGNDVAIAASREGRPYLDGSIIARLAWRHTPSPENNRVFGSQQSFVAGTATNVQVMVKDSRRYAATGGWGFAQFDGGKPASEAVHRTCAGCHAQTAGGVFTRYAR